MEQSFSWEDGSHSASQEISCLLWKVKVHHEVHVIPPLDPTLSQMTLVSTLTSYFLNSLKVEACCRTTACSGTGQRILMDHPPLLSTFPSHTPLFLS
jgi:hypothetical protein